MQEDAFPLKLVRKDGLCDIVDRLQEGVGQVGSGPVGGLLLVARGDDGEGLVFDELGQIPDFHSFLF